MSHTDWFEEARYGLFIHWGPYSVAARGEWLMNRERISPSEYKEKYVSHWKAERYAPEEWVALAKEVGMGYVVITTRHHDGFCLWDSKETNWCASKLGPNQDLLRPFVEAVRKAGLKVGFYFSGADWTHPDYPGLHFRDWPSSGDWRNEAACQRFISSYRKQVRELMTNYGRIDMLWWDGCMPEPFEGSEVNAMVKSLQPHILINERNGEPFDFRNSEQTINEKPGLWEACLTLNSTWGWHAGDSSWKSVKEIASMLVNCASKGGNLLLNVGPLPDGSLPSESITTLREVGQWLARNREFLSHSERHELSWNSTCQVSAKGSRIYLHFHHQPGVEFLWTETEEPLQKAWFLASGQPVDFVQNKERIILKNLPVPLPDSPITTIVLEFDKAPQPMTSQTTHWIPN